MRSRHPNAKHRMICAKCLAGKCSECVNVTLALLGRTMHCQCKKGH
jgi:hypothetical protein